ncbi:hypothetical protein [Nocardioides litoris]|uniref:hypothetical protein n=1 Tax=Nocardioides litoris TaxID=1926648 RepID=UPI00147782E0|nr:hypothetical protein [Nocardioides litoris]
MRRPTALLAVAGLVLTLLSVLTATAPSASAVVRRDDPDDSPVALDTRVVRLFASFRGTVTTQMIGSRYAYGKKFNGIEVYYDTRGGRGADYRLIWGFNRDGDRYQQFGLYRVQGRRVLAPVPCRGLDAKARPRKRTIEVYVPRACLSITKRPGVYTQSWDYTRYRDGRPVRGRVDRAPDRGYVR